METSKKNIYKELQDDFNELIKIGAQRAEKQAAEEALGQTSNKEELIKA